MLGSAYVAAALAWMILVPTKQLAGVGLVYYCVPLVICGLAFWDVITRFRLQLDGTSLVFRQLFFRYEKFQLSKLVRVSHHEELPGFKYRRHGWLKFLGGERFLGLSRGSFAKCAFSDGRTLILRSKDAQSVVDALRPFQGTPVT